ncbi:MAG: bifunctional tetrahydrofolate synthase/dihydrofolate synthase [Dokdonella sp.]
MQLTGWLDYQQGVHPRAIALGLDRVREVWTRLGVPVPAPVVITVGGTNGKGSTVAFLEAMLAAGGKRVGAYTSPHLLTYNERVRIAGRDVDDATFVAAFERIEAARGSDSSESIALTYFEYATLAALLIFADSALDVALLEVGLGGRLDAVNIIDADAAIVTTVDLDHQDWLGNDRGSIGREKAGIFRADRPAIAGEPDPPRTLIEHALRLGAPLYIAGRDFKIDERSGAWSWSGWADRDASADSGAAIELPEPALIAPCQVDNAAAAIAALYALRNRLGWNPVAIAAGVANARIAARMQRFGGEPQLIVDVAHNPQAAKVLAKWLEGTRSSGRTLAVFGALGDKDVRGVVDALRSQFDAWYLAGLDQASPRGLDADLLRAQIESVLDANVVQASETTVDAALAAAFLQAQQGDRVIAFGSFFVASAALRFAHLHRLSEGTSSQLCHPTVR